MSTVVCQGFRESHLLETTTTMRLKVVTPKFLEGSSLSMVDTNDHLTKEYVNLNNEALSENWNFLQSLNSSSSQTPKKALESKSLIIQPLEYKQSSILRLSERSLELCTESLGSESGSDTSESSILSLSLSDNGKSNPRVERNSSSVPPLESRKSTRRSFPPPLTTMSGSNSLQVKPHREGGRLIIQAMEVPSTISYFQTERSEGRLRLSFWENVDYKFDSSVSSFKEECEESLHEDEVVHVANDTMDDERSEKESNEFEEEEEEGIDNDMMDDERSEKESNEFEEEEGIDYDEYVQMIRDMDGNSRDVEAGMGIGMGMEKFQRATIGRSRCKENGHGDKGLGCNWEAIWVATS